MKRSFTVLLILIFSLACAIAHAYSETVQLAGHETTVREIELNEGDRLSGSVRTVGSAINFSIADPDDLRVFNRTVTGSYSFDLTAAKTGIYRLHVENLFSEETKSVTLNYNVQRYIFGFPQEYIILFFIVGLALVAIAVFVAMSPKP
ncbi:MAG: hypothetical protein JSV64_06275 [Candidatus Bathyarchaeota archaeon]|nr:MAG: hypothetical protein JSV64_06275 [Candidatus Bathyarchaeota archaeon]